MTLGGRLRTICSILLVGVHHLPVAHQTGYTGDTWACCWSSTIQYCCAIVIWLLLLTVTMPSLLLGILVTAPWHHLGAAVAASAVAFAAVDVVGAVVAHIDILSEPFVLG